jgi:Tfp pilus assembly protein PilN
MRPINLIPEEERRGQHAALRSGPVLYIAIGALVAALVGVTALVLTDNQISERKAEAAELHREDAAAKGQAERLAAYTAFRSLHDQRLATITSLADSRFDWERVMRELSLVLPSDVWLTNLGASVAPGVSIEGGGSSAASGLRGGAAGPALELDGCATGQEAVAGFVTALRDIDGVTRVGVQSSGVGEEGGGGAESDCRTRGFIVQFAIAAAFDAAPVSPVAGSEEAAPPAEEEPAPEEPAPESTPTSAEG